MTPEELFKKSESLAYFTIKKFYPFINTLQDMDREDARQVALERLWVACLTFDETKGTEFSTYAVTCVRNGLRNWLRDKFNVEQNENTSLSSPVKEAEYSELTLEDCLVGEQDVSPDYTDKFLERLDPREQLIVRKLLEGYNQADIAKELDLSRERVRQIIEKIKRRTVPFYGKECIDEWLRSTRKRPAVYAAKDSIPSTSTTTSTETSSARNAKTTTSMTTIRERLSSMGLEIMDTDE